MFNREQIGKFRLYPPDRPGGGWQISYDEVWLPVSLADRDSCLVIAGMVLAGVDDGVLEAMQDRVNRAQSSRNVTHDVIEDLMRKMP
jgi:DNA-binding cell septation regulator SpoVG